MIPLLEGAWLRHRAVHRARVREANVREQGRAPLEVPMTCRLARVPRLVCRDSCVKVRPIVPQRPTLIEHQVADTSLDVAITGPSISPAGHANTHHCFVSKSAIAGRVVGTVSAIPWWSTVAAFFCTRLLQRFRRRLSAVELNGKFRAAAGFCF